MELNIFTSFYESIVNLYSVSILIGILTFICLWAWKLIFEVSLHIYAYNSKENMFYSKFEEFCLETVNKNLKRKAELNILYVKVESKIEKIKNNVATILILSSISPLIGLLGTVQGMVETFYVLGTDGMTNNAYLTGGISAALITTQCGLVVAIPTYLAGGILNRKTQKIRNRLRSMALHAVSNK